MSEVAALQTTLAAEHAAMEVLAALASRTSQAADPGLLASLQDAYAQHRARRDQLTTRVADLGATPTPAAAGYELPSGPDTPEAVAGAARDVEDAAAATYAFLVGSSTGDLRRWAVTALTDAAVRSVGLGAEPVALPGLSA